MYMIDSGESYEGTSVLILSPMMVYDWWGTAFGTVVGRLSGLRRIPSTMIL